MYYNDYNRSGEQAPIEVNDFQVGEVQPEKHKKSKNTAARTVALCLVCALAGGLAGGAAGRVFPGGSTVLTEGSHAPVAVSVANITNGQAMSGAQVYAANVGSTVGITTELVTTNFWGQRVKGAAAGSGFVITQDGYILTNYHVIDGASSIKVAFSDGTSYDAKLVGGEQANDIAVLKIEATGLPAVTLGDSDNLVVGEQVCAIGNPLGELTFTYTSGSVSAKDRSITMQNGEVMNMIQTDTAINSGNSGGPLFNLYGEVIGITSAKYSSSGSTSNASIEGIGFAIPINDVKGMVKDIMEKGYVTGKPNLGILMNDVSADAVQRYGIPAGAYIEAVLDGSCAEKAGLKAGDIITAAGNTAITSSDQLKSAVKNYKAGDSITLTVYREGKEQDLTITLDEADQKRAEAMSGLQQEYQAQNQPSGQAQQPQDSFGWPFGNLPW